jgi:hypothetical protein
VDTRHKYPTSYQSESHLTLNLPSIKEFVLHKDQKRALSHFQHGT